MSRALRIGAIFVAGLILGGCGAPQALLSNTVPTRAIVQFPNSFDRQWTTNIMSNPFALQSGVNGRVLTIALFHGAKPIANVLTIDALGNIGINGTISSRSSRAVKKDIRLYPFDALSLLRDVRLAEYHYVGESSNTPLHVGFIAEQTSSTLSGVNHDSFNLNNSVGLSMAAAEELDGEVHELRAQLAELKDEVNVLRGSRIACAKPL